MMNRMTPPHFPIVSKVFSIFILCGLTFAQDAVNPCEILSESLNCSGAGLHGAEVDFKTIKLNGKRKNDPMVSVGEELIIKTAIKYTKRAKAEITTTFNGGCPVRTETKRLKPETAVTYSATLDGNTYNGSGSEFSVNAPLAIGSYPLVVTFTATAVNGCIDNVPLGETKTFILDVIDGAYILSLDALKTGTTTVVDSGAYLCKGQGQEIDFSVTFSDPLNTLPFGSNDIVWTVSPPDGGTFSGPSGANGDTVTWIQADDFVSAEIDDLVITVNAPDMQPRSFYFTVYGINSTSGVLGVNETKTFLIEDADISPSSADKGRIATLMNGVTDVGTGTKTKLRTRTFSPPSPFNNLENEAFLPAEADQTDPTKQIIKKATFSEVSGTLVVEIQSGPVEGDVNITWEKNRTFGGRKILHREHMTVTSGMPVDSLTLVLDGTNDEGPLTRLMGDSVTLRAIPTAGSFVAGFPVWQIGSNQPNPITSPTAGSPTFPLSNLPPGEYTITASIGPTPGEKDTFTIYVYQVDLDVDTNRDAIVDASDETGENAWTAALGAIFAVNYDDDDADSKVDGMDFSNTSAPTNEDHSINGALDVEDIAPLVIPKVGSKADAQFFLRMDKSDARAVHIFESRTDGATALKTGAGANWSGWTANPGGSTGPIEIEITHLVKEQADLTLGIESLFFPGGSVFTSTTVTQYTYDGEITIEYIAQSGTGSPTIDPAKQIGIDTVVLRTAPYLLLPNTQDADEIFMHGISTPTYPDADEIESALGAPPSVRVPTSTASQWFQDHVQIGYTGFPSKPDPANAGKTLGQNMWITLRNPYQGGQDDWPETHLRESNHGLFRFRDTYTLDTTASPKPGGGEFGGNIELVPKSHDWPHGRIIYGNNIATRLSTFFKSQKAGAATAVQEPFDIDTDWLFVGHVDEMVSFAPAPTHPTKGYKVVVSSPQYARDLIHSGSGPIAAPPDHAAIYAKGTTTHGKATNAFTSLRKRYLFDGVAHGYIHCIPAGDLVDGETITLNDGFKSLVLEFDDNGMVLPGNIQIDITTLSSATTVRDALLTQIVVAGMEFNLIPDMERVLIFHKQFGTQGDQTILHTVADGGFSVMGLVGAKTIANGHITFVAPGSLVDGETFTLKDGLTTKTFEFDNNAMVAGGHVLVDFSAATSADDVRDAARTAISAEGMAFDFVLQPGKLYLFNKNFGTAGNQPISETVANAGFSVTSMTGGSASISGNNFNGYTGGWVRLYKGTGHGQVAQISGAGKGYLLLVMTGDKTFDTTSETIHDVHNGIDGLFNSIEGPATKQNGWYTEPDASTDYIVASDCFMWQDGSGADFPALWSVYELKNDSLLDSFTTEAQGIIDGAATAIITKMGNVSGGGSAYLKRDNDYSDDDIAGDSNDDFIEVPTFYFGAFNKPTGTGTFTPGIYRGKAEAFNPGLVNFQPASASRMAFPKPYMAKNLAGDDVFEKATTEAFGASRVHFANDWNLYHRKKGEVHCGTAAKRDHHTKFWWEAP